MEHNSNFEKKGVCCYKDKSEIIAHIGEKESTQPIKADWERFLEQVGEKKKTQKRPNFPG